ncbi:hypothetical protein LINPERPRIM_LOCUS42806 [Linum perenne]
MQEIVAEMDEEINAEMDEEINAEMNEEINPEIDAEMIEDVDLQIREDFLNEETLSEIGDNAKVFSRSLGIIVRTPRVVPVRMMKWNELSENDLDFIWAVAQEYFRNANMAAQKVNVMKYARILWNKSRSNLYREFVEKCNSSEEAIENIPPMMDKEDWKIEEHGEEPSYPTILEFSYKKGDTVKDAYAAEKVELARKTKEEAPDSTIYDLAKICFGKQLKHGTVVGLGGGIKPRDLKRNTSNSEDLASKLRETEEEKAILQKRLEAIEVASEKREQEMAEMKGEVEKMKEMMQILLQGRPS